MTEATALPRSSSSAPLPAAPKTMGAATEIPAPPMREADEGEGQVRCDCGQHEPSARGGGASDEEQPIAEAHLEPLPEQAPGHHRGREEPRAEGREGRRGVELGLQEERAPVLDAPFDHERDPAEHPEDDQAPGEGKMALGDPPGNRGEPPIDPGRHRRQSGDSGQDGQRLRPEAPGDARSDRTGQKPPGEECVGDLNDPAARRHLDGGGRRVDDHVERPSSGPEQEQRKDEAPGRSPRKPAEHP